MAEFEQSRLANFIGTAKDGDRFPVVIGETKLGAEVVVMTMASGVKGVRLDRDRAVVWGPGLVTNGLEYFDNNEVRSVADFLIEKLPV